MQFSIRYPLIDCEVWVGRGLLGSLPALCRKWGRRAVIVADRRLESLGERLAAECCAHLLAFESGERSKTRAEKERLEDALLERKFGRDTVIVALGGGVATDLVGFLASTYMRGAPLILVPTTLLAIVDASIGGKTAVDTPQGKNLIGSFYPPKAIVSDLDLLDTLPERERLNGMAEILKAGLIADASLWSMREPLEAIVEKAVRVKVACVEKDPFDQGLRRILNFGHTVAHALEAVAEFDLPHGEAVAIGMIAESFLSWRTGLLEKSAFEEIRERIEGSGFALKLPDGYERSRFFEAMAYDKKSAGGEARFALLEEIGRAAAFDGKHCASVPREKLEEMVLWMEVNYG